MYRLPACRSRPESYYHVIRGTEICGVLHFGCIQRLACRAISASAELLVTVYDIISFPVARMTDS